MADENQDMNQEEQVQEETVEETSAQEETPVVEETSASPEPVVEEVKKEEKPKKEVSKNLEGIIETIEKLSVLELADLVKALEDRFGVTAAAPMAVASASPAAAGGDSGPSEEQTSFNVVLTNGGANKIAVIKAVRELVPTLGLKEAKDLVEGAPKAVLEGASKDAANEAKAKLTAAGGTVELQ